jgi:hypothetical protein
MHGVKSDNSKSEQAKQCMEHCLHYLTALEHTHHVLLRKRRHRIPRFALLIVHGISDQLFLAAIVHYFAKLPMSDRPEIYRIERMYQWWQFYDPSASAESEKVAGAEFVVVFKVV